LPITACASTCVACTSRASSCCGSSLAYLPRASTLKSSMSASFRGSATRYVSWPCTVTSWKSRVVVVNTNGRSALAAGTITTVEVGR
jgi:hypothetical protein